MTPQLKILIIGSGGREHALLKACLRSPLVEFVIAAPGNGGMQVDAPCFPVGVNDSQGLLNLAKTEGINFVIVGPEDPLANGLADVLRAEGLAVYGPGDKGARLEASKAYCKDFFHRYSIPTAAYGTFQTVETASGYLDQCSFPIVVKASGLAAGKGVLICEDRAAADEAIHAMLEKDAFGESGKTIIIESFLEGPEASIMVMVSGDRYVVLPPSQDHKRIGEGDTGLNTGGMGAYAPTSAVTPEIMQLVRDEIIQPTLEGFKVEGIDFRGTLFIGLVLTKDGPKVLEYNVRFGDPECQVLLPLCRTDPVKLMYACATGTLEPKEVEIEDKAAMIVVLASEGYPGSYKKGDPIGLPSNLPDSVQIIHAGTQRDADNVLRSNGGRVLGVVSTQKTLEQAAKEAYAICEEIEWSSKQYRRDIGWRELKA